MMNTVKHFHFIDRLGLESTEIIIPEIIDGDYGFYTWPCAPVLAQYIWFHRDKVIGKTTLELGAGTALPSIVAARCGAKVHISDSASRHVTLQNSKKSVEMNKLDYISFHALTWGKFDPDSFSLPEVDIVLSSDCFYDAKDFEDVVVTLAHILARNPRAEIWCTYQERSASRSIEHLLRKWKIRCRRIQLSSFNADYTHLAGSELPGDHTVHMYILCSSDHDVSPT